MARFYVLMASSGLALWCAGCALVDQTTFGAKPTPPAPDQITVALATRSLMPLVVIRGDGAAYDDALRTAVDLAQARRPGASYDLVVVVPAGGVRGNDLDGQIAQAERSEGEATDVMAKLTDYGVDPERIHLAVRAEPEVSVPELRIYVR